jgi:hypothetical protein
MWLPVEAIIYDQDGDAIAKCTGLIDRALASNFEKIH